MSQSLITSFLKSKDGTSKSNEARPSKTQKTNIVATPSAPAPQEEPKEDTPLIFISQRLLPKAIDDSTSFERDPALRFQIHEYNVNDREKVQRAYLKTGPFQPGEPYPLTFDGRQNRGFNKSYYDEFPWLEYSPTSDKAYCFPCFIFETNPPKRPQYTSIGLSSWKRVHDGSSCAFIQHMGAHSSPHRAAVSSCDNLMSRSLHVDQIMNTLTKEEILRNRLQLKATIKVLKWLALQGCGFRGHDESRELANRGNFIELLKLLGDVNEDINNVILDNARGNAKYTSSNVKKKILHIFSERVRKRIREEVGDSKFCILVDEAQDSADREKMAIILRFVDKYGILVERFFHIVGVDDTNASTLKSKISGVLSHYDLHVSNMRGQGYDGASNMRGSWNGLQTLFLKECPYAYYVNCFAHRLQLDLVAASKDQHDVWMFFSKLVIIVNLVGASPKRKMQLQAAKKDELRYLEAIGELETGTGANQFCNVQQAGATRWSSHFASIRSLIDLYNASCVVLEGIMQKGSTNSHRGEAKGALDHMKSFDFVFMLHLMHETMGITDVLCQTLQEKTQDILNAMSLVKSTKKLLQKSKGSGWATFIHDVVSFCKRHGVIMQDMNAPFLMGTGRTCQQKDCITIEHHYHFDLFMEVINYQLMELASRFTEEAMELLTLSARLDPADDFKLFDSDMICTLAEKFYPDDFTNQEINLLKRQLAHYEVDDMLKSKSVSTLSELCRRLVEIKKAKTYSMIYRLICLVLTLPVSTATTERAFSAMKLLKTDLRNKIGDEFLVDCMVVYIERGFAKEIDLDSIIDEFDDMKNHRLRFK